MLVVVLWWRLSLSCGLRQRLHCRSRMSIVCIVGFWCDVSLGEENASASSIAWCRARSIPRSARFEIALYGEENAAALARAWSSKMQFLLSACLKVGDDLHKFSPEELAKWPEPSDLGRVSRDMAGVAKAQKRIVQIRQLG